MISPSKFDSRRIPRRSEIRAVEKRTGKIGPGENCSRELRPAQIRAAQIRVYKYRSSKLRVIQMSARQF